MSARLARLFECTLIPSENRKKIKRTQFEGSSLQVLWPSPRTAHLKTKRSHEGTRVGARWAKRGSEPKESGNAEPPNTDSAPPLLSEVEKEVPQVGLSTGVCADSPQLK
jgi:hypothetical protein